MVIKDDNVYLPDFFGRKRLIDLLVSHGGGRQHGSSADIFMAIFLLSSNRLPVA